MSAPVFLYLLERGATAWRKAASARDVTALGETWTASSISHSDVEMSGEAERDAVKLTLPITEDFAADTVFNRPETQATISIYRFDRDDSSYELWWSGRVTAPEVGDGVVELVCDPDVTALAQATLPRIYMRHCPHAVYYGECRLNRALFRVEATVTAISGALVTISGTSDSFSGGFVEASNGDLRGIKAHSGQVMTLDRKMPALAVGQIIGLYPGCARTPSACRGFANADNPSGTNIENYGGFRWMLTGEKNPFAGSSVT